MTTGVDRRALLMGASACGAAACAPGSEGVRPYRMLDLDLAALEARHGGRLGVSANSQNNRASATWRAAERFTYCSTFKLFLAAAALDRDHRTVRPLSWFYPVTQADLVVHSPVTERFVAQGQDMMVADMCAAIVEVSDNAAANVLIREMGGVEAFQAWYRSIGDEVTRVDRIEPALNGVEGELDTTTPQQAMANIGKLLTYGEEPILIRKNRERLEKWLVDSPTGPNRIKAAAPVGWTVGHKTGTSSAGPTNDIAILRGPDGDVVLLTVFFEAPASTTPEQRDAVVADAARMTLTTLGYEARA